MYEDIEAVLDEHVRPLLRTPKNLVFSIPKL